MTADQLDLTAFDRDPEFPSSYGRYRRFMADALALHRDALTSEQRCLLARLVDDEGWYPAKCALFERAEEIAHGRADIEGQLRSEDGTWILLALSGRRKDEIPSTPRRLLGEFLDAWAHSGRDRSELEGLVRGLYRDVVESRMTPAVKRKGDAAVLIPAMFPFGERCPLVWEGIDLRHGDLRGRQFDMGTIFDCEMQDADFSEAAFFGTVLDGLAGERGVFSGASLAGVQISDCDFEGASFAEAELGRGQGRVDPVRASSSSFRGADFRRAWCRWDELRNCDFSEIDLTEAHFEVDDARQCRFGFAATRGARIRFRVLQNCSFEQADLRATDLRGSDFRGVDLRTAKLEGARLQFVDYDEATRFPQGFDPAAQGMRRRGR